jgi:hypothetical protein
MLAHKGEHIAVGRHAGERLSPAPTSKYVRDFKGVDHRSLAVASHRFRTIKICPKDAACVWEHSRPQRIPSRQQKGHVMSDMALKAEQERQGWTRPSDIAWATGYVIVTILLILLWANVPAQGHA